MSVGVRASRRSRLIGTCAAVNRYGAASPAIRGTTSRRVGCLPAHSPVLESALRRRSGPSIFVVGRVVEEDQLVERRCVALQVLERAAVAFSNAFRIDVVPGETPHPVGDPLDVDVGELGPDVDPLDAVALLAKLLDHPRSPAARVGGLGAEVLACCDGQVDLGVGDLEGPALGLGVVPVADAAGDSVEVVVSRWQAVVVGPLQVVLPAPLQPMMTVKVGGAAMAHGTPVAGRSVVARFRGPLCRWWQGDMPVVETTSFTDKTTGFAPFTRLVIGTGGALHWTDGSGSSTRTLFCTSSPSTTRRASRGRRAERPGRGALLRRDLSARVGGGFPSRHQPGRDADAVRHLARPAFSP